MAIVYQPNDVAKNFVDQNLLNYGKTKEVSSFIPLIGHVGDELGDPEFMEFAKSKDLPVPEVNRVFVAAFDGDGRELGRINLDADAAGSDKLAAAFVQEHAPPVTDAEKKWEQAFAEAKRTNRRVWVRISQRYCGPCFLMARWLDDQKSLLEPDFVLLKIDDVRDIHGPKVAKRLTGGENFGVPFHAIFDADEKMIVDSNGPAGNIGYPSRFEGMRHLKKMLMESRQSLTVKQIDQIIGGLRD